MPNFRQLATWNRIVAATATLVALIGGALLSGCAYHAGVGDRQVPGGYRAVAVPVFKNVSHEPGIEVYFTNAFIREMQRARIGTITDKASAQVTLEGTIDGITYASGGPIIGTGFTAGANGYPAGSILNSSITLGVTSTLRLRRNSDQKVLWEGTFTRAQTYQAPRVGNQDLSGANALYDHSARYQNIETLAQDMMAEAYDRLTENF